MDTQDHVLADRMFTGKLKELVFGTRRDVSFCGRRHEITGYTIPSNKQHASNIAGTILD